MTYEEQLIIFKKNFNKYVDESEKSQKDIAKELGYSYTTFNTWYRGKSMPDAAKIQTIADYFGIKKSDLLDEHSEDDRYYLSKEAQQYTEFLSKNPGHRVLFDASMKVSPEDLDKVAQMLGIFEKKD